MAFYTLDPLHDPRWDVLVARHPAASVFHTTGWLDTLRRTYGWKPFVVTTSPPNAELSNGVVLCRVRSWITGNRLVSLPFSDHCQPLTASSEDLCSLMSQLEGESRETYKYVEVRPLSMQLSQEFRINQQFHLHRLDLRPGADEVFRRFHRDCIQRKIRRAERESLAVDQGRSADLLRHFYQLVMRTRRRQGVPPQPMSWFQNLRDCLGTSMTVRLAFRDGKPVAGILTLEHKKTMVYKYGASDERFHNLGGMPLVFWHAIQDAIGRGLETFDLGRSDFDNPGLVAFKDHWGATRSLLSYWRSPADVSEMAPNHGWRLRLAHLACSHMPERCLSTVGALIYRHVA